MLADLIGQPVEASDPLPLCGWCPVRSEPLACVPLSSAHGGQADVVLAGDVCYEAVTQPQHFEQHA